MKKQGRLAKGIVGIVMAAIFLCAFTSPVFAVVQPVAPPDTLLAGKKVRPRSVTLSMKQKMLKPGQKVRLKPTVKPANAEKKATWKSSKPKVASVGKDGTVKALSTGKTTITCTIGGKKAVATIRVVKKLTGKNTPVKAVSLSSKAHTLEKGAGFTLEATVKPAKAGNKKVTWSSDDEDVASVTSKGEVLARSVGQATITAATDEGGKTAQCKVTVVAPQQQPSPPTTSEQPSASAESPGPSSSSSNSGSGSTSNPGSSSSSSSSDSSSPTPSPVLSSNTELSIVNSDDVYALDNQEKRLTVKYGRCASFFRKSIKASDNSTQSYSFWDASGEKHKYADIETGDTMLVTAEDGVTQTNYTFYIPSSETKIRVINDVALELYTGYSPNPIKVASGTTSGDLLSAVESHDGSKQQYRILNNNIELAPADLLVTGCTLEVKAENGRSTGTIPITVLSSETGIRVTDSSIILELDTDAKTITIPTELPAWKVCDALEPATSARQTRFCRWKSHRLNSAEWISMEDTELVVEAENYNIEETYTILLVSTKTVHRIKDSTVVTSLDNDAKTITVVQGTTQNDLPNAIEAVDGTEFTYNCYNHNHFRNETLPLSADCQVAMSIQGCPVYAAAYTVFVEP